MTANVNVNGAIQIDVEMQIRRGAIANLWSGPRR